MFIKFFKSSFFLQYLVIGITGMFLWLGAFLNPPGMPPPEGPVPLYEPLYSLLFNTPVIAGILGFCLVLFETYWLSRILSQHELVVKNSSLSALVFLVMMSFLPAQLSLNPINIALGFMILILHHLLISYNKPEHLDRIFAAGFFTAIASMFYLPFILWFVFVVISFLVFRAGNWRAWMAAFIGLITPFLYLAVWHFWHDRFLAELAGYLSFFNQIMVFPDTFRPDFYILTAFTLILAIWGIFRFTGGPERTVEIRIKTNILLWTLVFTLLSIIFSGSLAIFHPALAMPAISMVITGALFGLKRISVMEGVLLIYFFSVLINNLLIHTLAII